MISEDFAPILHTYLIVFGGALLIYDYVLTFSMEVERFWISHPVSAITTLYFVDRYVGLLGYLPILYQFLGAIEEDE
ncbi:hypothetical protein BDM02DRAFT_3113443 [Thelephora ganbajun]|uniref:Uncharacterized protein n=1 Tax=Thelephora ganbajun TaxID=370292 RepID=A0ACB6ZJ44_THEGA|nr:hypothetical protein BDM02DRAFT_3113443 [Thelephora ganbajun]